MGIDAAAICLIMALQRFYRVNTMSIVTKHNIKRLLAVLLASVIIALNINTFVQTGGLYPGGVTGLTILLQRIALRYFGIHLSFAVLNTLFNLVPVYIGFRYIGKRFTFYSCVCILLTGVLTDLLPQYVITYDMLLISIFGGIINGFALASACSSCRRSCTASRFSLRYLAPFLFWPLLVRRARVSLTCLATSSSLTSMERTGAFGFCLFFLPLFFPPWP